MQSRKTIIAELCQNHLGSRDIIEKMIKEAATAGADYVKLQTIRADYLTKRERFEEGVIENGVIKVIKRPFNEEFQRLSSLDLDINDHEWFIKKCHENNVKAMTTIFTRGVINQLAELDWDAIKVASYDCASFNLLREIKAKKFKKLYVSTGATFDNEIEQAAEILDDIDYTFLHCVTIYPTPLNQISLARLDYLKKFTNEVGFSDHTLVSRDGIKASIAALLYGANVIERHFSILDQDKTKDGPVSINPKQLQLLVETSKLSFDELKEYVHIEVPEYDVMIGEARRVLTDEELLNRDYYRGRFATKKDNGDTIYNFSDEYI